ncbi:tetratricopeptide repeat protein [Candidatus Nitronereus thalassa]|uniref:Tetratricopeptide repeat protein n=1 Tax=Candidatus Nitronereus thalassa TaxID=3020898 RepID=A0ABU3K3N7_9BACT|nr:tetratricopeptide repeat protein [Candidatus Nitronereus thalassa]MDT7040973.1 tetratricopeptide repeat protein [Candidatus Nitronereus thalassa]
MNKTFFVVALSMLVGLSVSGCDSGKGSDASKSEPAVMSEAEPSMEAPGEPAMEEALDASGPMALSAPDGVAGADDNNEGISHFQQGHFDVAQEHFQKAVSANSNLAEAHYNLALTLDKLGNHGEAANHFKTALDLAPDNPSIKDSAILQAHVKG